MNFKYLRHILAASVLISAIPLRADYEIPWEATTTVNAGSGHFAPYYIMSNRGGLTTQPVSIYETARLFRTVSTGKRFDYGFGAEGSAGWSSPTAYTRFNGSEPVAVDRRQPYILLQQLYGEVKFRGMFLTVGMKRNDRSLFDSPLGTGDITLSDNARAIPQVRIGFIDFQNIPFTGKWVQIQAEAAYGKFMDRRWLEDHFNYDNSFITTGNWFHYKRCYFRTNPDKPFSVTVGMQHAAQFGGDYRAYEGGVLIYNHKSHVGFKDFVDVFVQKKGSSGSTDGDRQYYNGNHLGSWDLKARYRFRNGSSLTAYFQWPWEDGSGIGKLNGFDGVWGLSYEAPGKAIINGAAVEYIDFTNQSGPIHWAPDDHPGSGIGGNATGADDYYNNFYYNGWANYGMSLGTPFISAPVYNRNGYMRFADNRIRGFQAGLSGNAVDNLEYRILASHRTSWGTPLIPRDHKLHDFSMMLEACYRFPKIEGLSLKGAFAFDSGSLCGTNVGLLVSLSYSGLIKFHK